MMDRKAMLELHGILSAYQDVVAGRDHDNPEYKAVAAVMASIEGRVSAMQGPVEVIPPKFGAEFEPFDHVHGNAAAPVRGIDAEMAAAAAIGKRIAEVTPINMGFCTIIRGEGNHTYFVTSIPQKQAIEVMQEFINVQRSMGL